MSTREITLDGGSPWGFRMHGGADVQQPLRISRVNPGSKAAQRGIREGDFISSINGQSTRGITNQEAHALLRNAGDTLTLGLNQENIGSPKRRAQKIQQDSKEDSLKRTSIASTSSTLSNISTINRILSNSYQNNESSTHTNGLGTPREAEQFTGEYSSYKKNNGTSTSRGATDVCQPRDTPDDGIIISEHNQLEYHTIIARPSASTNAEAHTATTADSDTLVISVAAPWQNCATASDNTADPLLDTLIMPDNVNGSSRSRKQRRSRSNRKRSKKCTAVTQNVSVGKEASTTTSSSSSGTQPIIQSDIDDNNTVREHVTTATAVDDNTTLVERVPRCDIVATDATPDCSAVCSETTIYRVESPKTVRVEKKTTIASSMVKSRSLDDDDDQVKITEITTEESAERTVCVSESTAIVSEAESDVEWEVVGELETSDEPSTQHFGKLSVISLPLQEHHTYEPSYISPEDERSLRDFLQGLNLVNSPEESVQRIEKTTTETAKSRRTKKRAALAQHFLPYYQNPRFLDVISEEGSDTSDKDNRQATAGVLRCIVDCNNDEYSEDEDDVFEDISSVKEQKLRNRFQSHFTGSGVGEGAILVGTRLIETDIAHVDTSALKEATWSTAMTETRSGAEVVYLEDSSESMTPSDLLDETTADLDADDEDDISIDLDKSFSESLDVQTSDSSSLIKSDVTLTSSSDNTESRASLSTDTTTTTTTAAVVDDQIKLVQHHTPPPTPDHISANDMPAVATELEISNPLDEKSIDSLPRLALTSPTSNKDVNISFPDNSSTNTNSSVEELCTQTETVEQRSLSEGLNKVINDISNLRNEKQQPSGGGENEEELNREIKLFCENLNKTAAAASDEYSNGAGESGNDSSRPNSSSSACSSSRSTSQCTAVYNPVHSSLTNIAAMLREGSCDDRVALMPSTLRELCVRALLTLPFGKEVIEELADVSLSIEEMTSETPSRIQNIVPTEPKPEPLLPSPSSSSSSSTYHHYQSYEPNKPTNTDASSVILVNNKHTITTDIPSHQPATVNRERWTGLPTEFDPNLLVCLSPSQRHFIDTTKTVPKEADSLLDLHRKFIERRGYHEEYEMPPPTANKELPPFQINIGPQVRSAYTPTTYSTENNLLKIIQNSSMDTNVQKSNVSDIYNNTTTKQNSLHNVHINYNNYVKQFTKEIPIQTVQSRDGGGSESKVTPGNICYDRYIKQLTREVPIQVERQIHKPVNNKIYEAACSGENKSTTTAEENNSSSSVRKDQRLNARHLGEWLNLARNDNGNKRHSYTECLTRVSNLHNTVNQLVTQRSYEENTSRTHRSNSPRRHSLPFNLYEKQMQYILEKEREIQREIEKLNEEKAKLETDMTTTTTDENQHTNESIPCTPVAPAAAADAKIKQFDAGKYQISRKGDIAILQTETDKSTAKSSMLLSPTTEKFRQEMYHEYMCKVAERQERKQNKVIKITTSSKPSTDDGGSGSSGGGGGGELLSPQCEVKHVCGIEDEFMSKVRERKGKLGLEEDEADGTGCDKNEQAAAGAEIDDNKDEPVLVLDGTTSLTDTTQLPKHLQEFVDIARASTAALDDGVWSPGKGAESKPAVPQRASPEKRPSPPKESKSDEPPPVVWTPRSAGSSPTADRKEFRPVSFESPVLGRKNKSKDSTPVTTPDAASTVTPPWEGKVEERTQDVTTTLSLERRLTTSHSAPAAGLNNLSKLPRAQNPTITLLQKAREGQLPRGASYIEQQQQHQLNQKHRSSKDDRPPLIGPNEILYTVKNEYMSESDSEKPKKMADLGPRKFEGIGPTTKDGMPIVLRSEVKDSNQAKWYKRMYDTLHRSRNDDEYVTVRYKTHRGRYPYTSAGGYLSEPEPIAYDSDVGISASKYATLDRRRLQPNRDKENEYITYTVPRNKYMSASVKHSTDIYKNQPGRIEDYVPGHSSISEKEAKEWWDEVMEIFDGWLDDHSALPSLNYMLSQVTARTHLEQQKHVPSSKSYMSHALKESGYESDSTLVFRRREDAALQLNPHDQKEAYKSIQRGGEVPLHGLRKPAPERPKGNSLTNNNGGWREIHNWTSYVQRDPPHLTDTLSLQSLNDDSDIEYFPISPTLTRIRVHKNVKPISEILCYPFTVHHQPLLSSTSPSHTSSSQVFSTYKRTAPSSTSAQPSPKLPTRPPSPPKRRSSRNSHTLRLISTMTIHTHSPKSSRRHETCFKSTADKSNVKFLRDRISCKLRSPTNSKKGVRVTKTISTYPSSSRESITTSVSSGKDSKLGGSKVKSKTDVSCKKEQGQHYSRSTASSTAKRCCHHCSFSVPPKLPDTSKLSDKVKHRGVSLERTFGSEKRKVDLTLPKMSSDRLKLVKSPDLVSPTEVRKGVQRQKDLLNLETKYYPPGTTVKKSTSLFSSTKNGLKSVAKPDEKALNVTVAITQRGKELLSPNPKSMLKSRSPSPLVSKSPSARNIASPAPSNISDKSKTSHKSRTMSVESLQSSTLRKRTPSAKSSSISRLKSSSISSKDELSGSDRERKRSKKVKKDQSNEELKKEKKKTKENRTKDGDKTKTKKCAGRAAGSEIVRKLKKMESTEKIPELIKSETIAEKQKDILQSDSFFQHLFLRDMLSSPTYSIPVKSSYVMERTKMLQNHAVPPHYVEPTVKALKVYLTHRKPVSESKFMALDREVSRSRSTSPLVLSRSLSERRRRFDSISELSNEESICGKRSISPESIYSRRSSSLPATKIVFSETSRPVSPVCDRSLVKYGKRNSPSPSPIRSPSRRRIHSIKPPASITVEGISGVKKKAVRARSAGEVESMKRELYLAEKPLTPSVSSVSLSQITDPHEYKTYVTELRHSAKKSDRFKELNHFYTSLERLSQLELTTSSSDLRPRRRHEDEIIDYDRWMQVRTRERAEQEFNYLYSKLKRDQKEKDLLFRPKDVDKFRWKHDREFAFRLKDNSVENIKEKFEQLKVTETPLEISKRRILDYQKDVYKPLWRGSSVLNLVSKIGDKRSQSDSRTAAAQQRMICSERLLSREIGSKLWSSLSVEQVNALKHQLAEIYSQTPQKKQDDYSINVESHTKAERPNSLVIRRNSANELSSQKPQIKKSEYVKSSSIGALASSQSLSENEKRRLSMSLSKEVHDKMTQRRKYISSLSVVLGKETRGAIAAAEANVKPPVPESTSPRTCYSLEPAEDEAGNKQKAEKDFLLVLTKDESEEQKQNVRQTLEERAQPKSETSEIVPKQISSTSETESASSDTSTKTAIFLGKKDELHKKIEYFERGADSDSYVPTIHRPADDDNDLTSVEDFQQSEPPVKQPVKKSSNLAPSQSYADLKELFGEKELMKFATLPLSATRKYISPQRPLLRASNISPIRTLSEASSYESLFRSRSMSPESEKFWNAYLALIKGVDVRKLTEKFETLKDFYSNRTSSHRRSKSDTELTHTDDEIYRDREFGDVYWLKKKYENIGRGRSRTRRDGKTSPISRIPLRVEDRLMPHINIISKLASLYPKKALTSSEKQKSVEDLAKELGCPVGEVEKIREKFESPDRSVSLLGHMFTSSPNVHELRDIAPYLAGQWIAHQYPRYQDNTRSLSAPEETSPDKRLVRRDHHSRPKSASPPRSRKQPSSILKSHHQQHRSQKDIFANQYYDPSVHRPTYRYQPHSPRAVDRGRTRSWSPSAKHTVTFKEPVLGPTPPPKGHHDNRDIGAESPRKYVEDEVTIHYRSPVRHEIKEVLSEEELARRQAEAMRRIYQEERRRKYLQELQDMNSRRHTDNFIPSQKSPIPLNRYDDFVDDLSLKVKPRDRSPEPRLVARALYNFVGQSSRELTFRKGDIIFIRRQVDKNWYEGEHNAMIGLFPFNYVEIIPYDGIKSTPRKAHEGQARAKFNFIAQTHLELSLAKGELVVLTRRVDDNWYEGRIGSRKGIFPVSYVEILIDPNEKQQDALTSSSKPVASPAAHSLLLNGSAGGKESMGSHHYQPSYTAQPTTTSYHAKPVNVIGTSASYTSLSKAQKLSTPPVNEALHIDTHSEPVPYRALYKYRPQNDDELELQEGDTVFVLEKCDDGWYVGSSQRTGAFGTFPGNYVERI